MSEPLECVLHIGTRKTGTSFVQSFLAENAALLRSVGTIVPDPSLLRPNQFELAYAASRGENLEAYDEGIGDRAGTIRRGELAIEECARSARTWKASRVLFSAEDLSCLRLAHIERLAGLLRARFDRVKVLCAVRSQDGYLASNVSTEVRAGATADPDKLFDRPDYAERYRLDFAAMLRDWESVFGREALSVWLYDRAAPADAIVRTVLDLAGTAIPPAAIMPAARANVALSAWAMRMRLSWSRWNRTARTPGDALIDSGSSSAETPIAPRAPASEEAVWWMVESMGAVAPDERWTPSPEAARAVRDRYAQSNERLRATWFPDRPAPLFDTPEWPERRSCAGAVEVGSEDLLNAAARTIEWLRAERSRLGAMNEFRQGQILAQLEDWGPASRHFARAIELDPAIKPQVLYHLALALEGLSRLDEARRAASQLVEMTGGARGAGLLSRLSRRLSSH